MPFVLDASMAASWAFTDESTAVAQQVLGRLTTDYPRSPLPRLLRRLLQSKSGGMAGMAEHGVDGWWDVARPDV